MEQHYILYYVYRKPVLMLIALEIENILEQFIFASRTTALVSHVYVKFMCKSASKTSLITRAAVPKVVLRKRAGFGSLEIYIESGITASVHLTKFTLCLFYSLRKGYNACVSGHIFNKE